MWPDELIFKAFLDSQQNWAEDTEISHIPPSMHNLPYLIYFLNIWLLWK